MAFTNLKVITKDSSHILGNIEMVVSFFQRRSKHELEGVTVVEYDPEKNDYGKVIVGEEKVVETDKPKKK